MARTLRSAGAVQKVAIRLSDVVKSSYVEDPANVYLKRPLQLLLTRLALKTSLTPNQVTVLALFAGLGAAGCMIAGSRGALLAGAFLLYSSALLDGVDGMLARVRKTSSETGHALDGAADYLVNLATTAAAAWHVAERTGTTVFPVALAAGAHIAWAHHVMLYDFQCATYLRFAKGGSHTGGDEERAAEILRRAETSGMSLPWRLLMRAYVWQLGNRRRLIARIDPAGLECAALAPQGAHASRYVAAQRKTMKLWALLSNSPHIDLLTLAVATDQLAAYLLLRVFGFSALAALLTLRARRLNRRLIADLSPEVEVAAA
ncbi:MAG TPA: CDP-alcohol phosphatidyltransferase family protein [Polyangiaceae bacterium]|jgi:phosphatidylglycerophosphate synthase